MITTSHITSIIRNHLLSEYPRDMCHLPISHHLFFTSPFCKSLISFIHLNFSSYDYDLDDVDQILYGFCIRCFSFETISKHELLKINYNLNLLEKEYSNAL